MGRHNSGRGVYTVERHNEGFSGPVEWFHCIVLDDWLEVGDTFSTIVLVIGDDRCPFGSYFMETGCCQFAWTWVGLMPEAAG